MYLVYLDESGNTGNNLDDPRQPIHSISGIIVPEEKIQIIETGIKELLPVFLPYSKNYDFEFHGTDLFQGKGYFKNFGMTERFNAFEKMVEIAEMQQIPFFSQSINKPLHKAKYATPYHPHNVAFMYLIEKIDSHLEQIGQRGIIVMDKCKDTEQQIINDFRSYREDGTTFGNFKREIKNLVDTVMYVDSFNSLAVQLADVLGYIHASSKLAEYFGQNSTTYHKQFLSALYKRLNVLTKYSDTQPIEGFRSHDFLVE